MTMTTADHTTIERDVHRIIRAVNPAAFASLDWWGRLVIRMRTALLLHRTGSSWSRAWAIGGMVARFGARP